MKSNADNQLKEEALQLLITTKDYPSKQKLAVLSDWKNRSDAHSIAFDEAQRTYRSVKQISPPKISLVDRLLLRYQIWQERFSYPLVPIYSIVAIVFVSAILLSAINLSESRRHIKDHPIMKPPPEKIVYRSGQAHETHQLDDGSTLWLDWSSSVEISFSETERHVKLLAGRASFDVVSEINRPFIVKAGDWTTRVTGTQFTVERIAFRDVVIEVIEGNVEVTGDRQKTVKLRANEHIKGTASGVGPIQTREPHEMTAWREGMLIFKATPLEDVLYALLPYLRIDIDLTYVPLDDSLVDGTFFTQQSEDALATLLASHDLVLNKRPNNRFVIRRKPLF
ncbi:MAG: FecR domain-containing protein [Pseudomonadota bacterium]